MSTQAIRDPNAKKIQGYVGTIGDYLNIFSKARMIAIVIWLSSAYMTSLLIESLRVTTDYGNANSFIGYVISVLWGSSFMAALLLQAVLTVGESAVFQKKNPGVVGWVCLSIDTLVNAASLWPYLKHFDNTPIWRFLAEAFPRLDSSYGLGTGIGITVLGGMLLAFAPEKFYSFG